MAAKAEAVSTDKSLVRKLAEVMAAVKSVPKTGRNSFHNYSYATEADIVREVRKEMAERGVMLVPSVEKLEWSERPSKTGVMKIATLTVRFAFLDGDSDSRIEFIIVGQGEDAGDKACYKALTGAEKYALLKAFLIPTGDDPEEDDDAEDDDEEARVRRARASRIWALAQQKGCTQKDWASWVTKALGEKKDPCAWTSEDMDRLEAAFNAMSSSPKNALPEGSVSAPKPRPVVDVRPGESEEQAKARTEQEQHQVGRQTVTGETTLEKEAREKREAAAKVEATQASIQLGKLAKDMAWTWERMVSVIKGATGKQRVEALVLSDVEKVKAAVEMMMIGGAAKS